MKRLIFLTAFMATLFSICSCKNSGKALLPNVSGKAGEIAVVINKGDWEGAVGTELRDLLTSDCPFLPQKEPLYNLANVSPAGFTNMFQLHRNIIFCNIDAKVSDPGVVYKVDQWAKPQTLVIINAPDSDTAVSLIKENGTMILNTFEQAERDRVIMNCIQYEESSLRAIVNKAFGGSPYFPSGYSLKKQTDDFIWIGYDTQYTIQGIFVYRYPATGKDILTIDNIIARRNEILKANVPGMFENTYMTTAEAVAPNLEYLKYRGREFAQVRGFWEVHNDFMGGPFISHSFYSPDGKDIIVLEAFVYAPKYDKRNYLRQVESIIYSFEWADRQGKEENEGK
ncbi:MAG: DUF4837 family protein [Bacteroidetes bacterium]|uniref:DUF4837 family protein n=1 Tax=Candidatus Cryptobacteroides merdavium TaxID=2840769 RepID=A0A9D9EBD0_9BACT|nr:DUF4837 family protein [Candidatus Cryptobacteroides merdavium]